MINNHLCCIEDWILRMDALTAATMTFGYCGPRLSRKMEPQSLMQSPFRQQTGHTICSLGRKLAADVPRRFTEEKDDTLLTIISHVTPSDRSAADIWQEAHAKKERITQEQSQAMTGMMFRHALEMLPGSGTASSPGQATPIWQSFWYQAVEQAVRDFHTSPPGSSPLLPALHNSLSKACKKDSYTGRVRGVPDQAGWIVNESHLGRCGHDLYGTLSSIIHQHGSQNFTVQQHSFSPREFQVLKAIAPVAENIQEEGVDWKEEKRRFF